MPLRPDELRLISQPGEFAFEPTSAPLPQLAGVVYAHPNPDGSRKNCLNCFMWASSTQQCDIHAPYVRVSAESVCGYHVYGNPRRVRTDDLGVDPVEPELSGLTLAPGGTSCDTCTWFDRLAAGGQCMALANEDTGQPPVPVEALGCCARWQSRGGPA